MIEPLSPYPIEDLLHYFLPKLLVATVVGGLVGLERELEHKQAGLKTFILICTGSTLYTCASIVMGPEHADISRISAQIVTGVGFIGGGTIFRSQDKISGLTTAAFIWVVAALGILIGAGGSYLTIALAIGLIITIQCVKWFERFVKWMEKRRSHE